MPDVPVRDVDDAALTRLGERASGDGRPLDAEPRMIPGQASRTIDIAAARARADEIGRRPEGRPHADGAELLREDRSR